MKHTDFNQQEIEFKKIAILELAKAVEAHGGRYEWCDEDGNLLEGATPPYVCVFLESGIAEVKIAEVIHDEKGWYVSGESTDEWRHCRITIDDLYDMINASQIQNITNAIPATDELCDATVLQPKAIGWLDGRDLKVRGFDPEKVTNEKLESVANQMLNSYLDFYFYDDMEEACCALGIPRVEGWNEND